MSTVALPTAGGSGSFGRFAANAAGAGAGLLAYVNFIYPHVPAQFRDIEFYRDFGVNEVLMGATALVGAMVANEIFNKVSGK